MSKQYRLVEQLRDAISSVPGNIAEGFKRRSPVEKVRFLNIAEGSLAEARNYLILLQDLGWLDTSSLAPAADEASRLLNRYMAAIERRSIRRR